MEVVFWVLGGVIAYVYAGYPLLLALLTGLGLRRPIATGSGEPGVTLLISAFNEAEVIAAKIENSLALDYPRAQLDVIVISDASDDGTDAIVERYASQGVRLLRMTERGGKTLGLNAGVRIARGQVVVFSDANATQPRCAGRTRCARGCAASRIPPAARSWANQPTPMQKAARSRAKGSTGST